MCSYTHISVPGGKGAGHDFWNSDIAQGHNTQGLDSNGTKMADKTGPLSSISKWNDTQRCHGSCKALLKDQGAGSAQILEISAPSPKQLEILPLISIWNYPAYKNLACKFQGRTRPLQWPTLCLWNAFLSESE